MKTIIVATDFSPAANNALEYAIAIARNCKAKLVIFNSLEPPVPTSTASLAVPGVYKMLAENKKRLEKLTSRISIDNEIWVEYISNISYVAEELEKQVKRLQADLVVMGMRNDCLDRKLFGSTTTSVIRHAKFPVLIIPEGVSFLGFKKFLFACDYSFLPKAPQLRLLKELASMFKSEIQFLHIDNIEKEPESLKQSPPEGTTKTLLLEETFNGLTHSYREIKNHSIKEGIKRGIRDFQADLLIMTPHKTGFFDFIFNRSITRKMALTTNIPLLTLPYYADSKDPLQPGKLKVSDQAEEATTGLSFVD